MSNFRIVQVTNVAPTATKEQMKTLFSYIGRIDELKLYPVSDLTPINPNTGRICYVKYDNSSDAGVACHLTNTVFIDRALIVVPAPESQIPDEDTAMKLGTPGGSKGGSGTSNWPVDVVNRVTGTGSFQMIMTIDPMLATMGLPEYPPLPATYDNAKIDEIRRSVYVEDIDPTVSTENLMTFFNQAGEIKFLRMAGTDSSGNQIAFIEFSNLTSIPTALAFNGVILKSKPVKVTHSTTAIVKPVTKQEAGSREVEEAMKKVKEAQSLISAVVDPEYNIKRRSRSPRRSSRRSSSRSRHSRSRRSRSKSKSKQGKDYGRKESSRKRSRSRKRSTSKSRRKSRSRSRKRSRSPRRRKSRSKSRERRRRKSKSRSPTKKYRKSSRSASREKKKKKSVSPKRASHSKSVSPKKKTKEDSESPERRKSVKPKLSPTRKKRSRSRSAARASTSVKTINKRRSRSRSHNRSRSRERRSRSRHRKEKKRSRSRSRDRNKKKREKDSKSDVIVKRDYDAEEKEVFSSDDGGRRKKKQGSESPPPPPPEVGLDESKDNLQQMDMDVDSD